MKKITKLRDETVPVRLKLFGLWASILFCFVYGDYFELYTPGKLRDMLAGRTLFGPVSENTLLGMSGLMVLPCLMSCLTLLLPAAAARWLNVVAGLAYAAVMLAAIQGAWRFYIAFGLLEAALLVIVVVTALRWPKVAEDDL